MITFIKVLNLEILLPVYIKKLVVSEIHRIKWVTEKEGVDKMGYDFLDSFDSLLLYFNSKIYF